MMDDNLDFVCPECESKDVKIELVHGGMFVDTYHLKCRGCGNKWREMA